jgi:hypothetical protein
MFDPSPNCRKRSAFLLIAAALLLSTARVRGAPPDGQPLSVAITECSTMPIGATEFLSALEVELELPRRPLLTRVDAPAAITVGIDCSGRAWIRTTVNGTKERRIRLDDVPVRDRARALALVVAELLRSGTGLAGRTHDADGSRPRPQHADDLKAADPGGPPAAEGSRADRRSRDAFERDRGNPSKGSDTANREGDGLKLWVAASIRRSLDVGNATFSGGAGMDWRRSRLLAEVGFAHAERPRGRITSGIGDVRYRHAVRLTRAGILAFDAALSAAAGVCWAEGDSEVVGVVVRRVLSPYADARLELSLDVELAARIAPEIGVYAGRAAGLLATDAGRSVLSSGGWFLGTTIGSTF